jgi:predicted TIM-barrel fold metal-dependent hydrolase
VTDWDASDHYVVISADGHAGADLLEYRPFLAKEWLAEFDAWAAAYVNPFADLLDPDVAPKSWDSDRRQRELEADGIAAEVLFPNTIPPFFPSGNLLAPPPTVAEHDRRWAGIRAHNTWLADFCAKVPGRRAGIGQILLHDVDAAVAEVRRIKELGLTGGVLLPGVAPNTDLPPLFADDYEPLWAVCEELDLVVNHHGGGGLPEFGVEPIDRTILLIELPIFSHRAMWHLIFAGVFERHPALKFALTEQGTGWIPGGLSSLDWFYRRMMRAGTPESLFGGEVARKLSLTPSEYFARNCYVGASFLRPIECTVRHDIGVDRIMWGSDYPHSEGSWPYTREALRASFADVPEPEVRAMLAGTAAGVYGFDLELLGEVAGRIGPTVDEVAKPLDRYPPDSTCNAFDEDAIIRAW